MNAYDYILRDQVKIETLINELLEINLHAVQQRFFDDIKARLILHVEAKRQVLYPAFAEDTQTVDLHRQDGEILELLDRLTVEGMTSPKWMVLFGELKHAVSQQRTLAQSQLYPLLHNVILSGESEELTARMDRAKAKIAEEKNLSVDHVEES